MNKCFGSILTAEDDLESINVQKDTKSFWPRIEEMPSQLAE